MKNDPQPNPQGLPPISRRERVDRAGDEFERRFRARQHPRIEEFVSQVDESDQDLLAQELIALEMALRDEAGDKVDASEYLGRFDVALIESARASFQKRKDANALLTTADLRSEEWPTVVPATSIPKRREMQAIPQSIGRYEILRRLGWGGFAIVYLARDTQLARQVALKVPRLDRFDSEDALDVFVEEARKAAQLEHPGIVRVHDVQREPGLVYIVQPYLAGGDLASHAKAKALSPKRIAELLASVADAVGYAHHHGFVHRDLKPDNILVDENGKPLVADFGLALHESSQSGHAGELAGTLVYMSPEQVRGEVHRLDGRSDIWSLGVILYELLAGQRPFSGATQEELFDEIEHRDPRPPRQIDRRVPRELSRICLTCLAKRATDRYQSAADLIDDLRHWLEDMPAAESAATGSVATGSVAPSGVVESGFAAGTAARVIPQGLRSFEAEHSDFYLELLPGPHDREGLPNRVRFWKSQIEKMDADETFAVGLMYGPSGCGKSSLVKAGLTPRLSEEVLPIYVEATAADTEVRLLKSLRKRCPELPADASLPALVSRLRRHRGSRGRKVLIVLDQFEQWLHAHESREDSQLLPALRHCDGGGVQCVVLVRDDFWMAVTRFFRALEVPLVEGHNSAAVDLFDVDHARRVLTTFGRAYGKLPELPADPSREQIRFLERAVEGLADQDKVICVRLAVFSEMMKGRPWTDASLAEVGGADGVGVSFLEETFSATTAPPSHRLHEKAIRAVLKELLPELGTNIKGQMRSHDELLAASGYAERREEFGALLGILDGQLRLITPTEPDTQEGTERATASKSARYFQLTHDFLIPSLRTWLTRKQRETRRGQAELRLAARSAVWIAKPETRHLPSAWEFASIAALVARRSWTPAQRQMMRRAGRMHGARAGVLLVVMLLLGWAGFELRGASRADALVQSLRTSEIARAPSIVRQLRGLHRWASGDLIALRESGDNNEQLRASLALLPWDPAQVEYLKNRTLDAEPAEVDVLRRALQKHKADVVAEFCGVLRDGSLEANRRRLQAACCLAFLASNDEVWGESAVSMRLTEQLVREPPSRFALWKTMLAPAGPHFINSLGVVFRNGESQYGEAARSLATDLLRTYAATRVADLSELLLDASEPEQFVGLYDAFAGHGEAAARRAEAELDLTAASDWRDPPLDAEWSRVPEEARHHIEEAGGLLGERFALCQAMPLDQFTIICEQLRPCGYRPTRARPYDSNETVHVAAIWNRDGVDWKWLRGASELELQESIEAIRDEGFFPVDAATCSVGGRVAFFALLRWNPGVKSRTQFVFDKPNAEKQVRFNELVAMGFAAATIQVRQQAAGGETYFSQVFEKPETPFLWEQRSLRDQGTVSANSLNEPILDLSISKASDGTTEYSTIWRRTTDESSLQFESIFVASMPVREHVARCQELMLDQFRPVAVSVLDGGQAASAWQRPVVPESEKERLARRQANAAIALLRMGRTQRLWPLLRHSEDPRLRSWITHQLASFKADPAAIIARLETESEVSVRRALLAALGEYSRESLPDPDGLTARLLDLYERDPDSGVHGAAAWALRRWGAEEQMRAINAQLVSRQRKDDRHWYVTRQGHTMVKIAGPKVFLEGSPSTEVGRSTSEDSTNETLRQRRIGRSFAISAHEVTVEQFQKFARDAGARHSSDRRFSPTLDCPQAVTWFQAAAYCRWLSEQEGIPENQMCYGVIESIKEGMTLPAGHLSVSGYRLPSESEWEYACRSGAATSRSYGASDAMLGKWAWYLSNSEERTWPVGQLRPNDLGLFDMHGNAWEWCQNPMTVERQSSGGFPVDDREDERPVAGQLLRVYRGGAVTTSALNLRSATINFGFPGIRGAFNGFRVARTIP